MHKNNYDKPRQQDELLYSWISSFSSKKKTTVIELIGLPGSGKSTLANAISLWRIKSVIVISDANCSKDVGGRLLSRIISILPKIRRRLMIVNHRLELLIQNNKSFTFYKNLIDGSSVPKKVKRARLRMWLSCDRSYRKKSNNSHKNIFIHDEGLIYRAVSLSQSGVDLQDIDQYLNLLPTPDAMIYIHTSSDVIKERLNKREYKTVNHIDLMGRSEIGLKKIRSKYHNIESFDYYTDEG